MKMKYRTVDQVHHWYLRRRPNADSRQIAEAFILFLYEAKQAGARGVVWQLEQCPLCDEQVHSKEHEFVLLNGPLIQCSTNGCMLASTICTEHANQGTPKRSEDAMMNEVRVVARLPARPFCTRTI